MPQEALPVAPAPITRRGNLRREFFDPLLRPMSGTVILTGSEVTREGEATVVPVRVKVPLLDGVLSVFLPPDTYTLEADLWTLDDVQVHYSDMVVVGGEAGGR